MNPSAPSRSSAEADPQVDGGLRSLVCLAGGAVLTEDFGFWLWLLTRRWRSRGHVLDAVATHAPQAHLSVVRTPPQVPRFLTIGAS